MFLCYVLSFGEFLAYSLIYAHTHTYIYIYIGTVCEVLESLKRQTSETPKPFPISKQYKSKSKKEDEKADGKEDAEDAEEVDQPVESQKSSLKISRPKAKGKTVSKKVSSGDTSSCKYVPEVYAKTRQAFIDQLRKDGISFSVASSTWNLSKQKRSLLSGVSVSELKRRRFLPKGSEKNPWAGSG